MRWVKDMIQCVVFLLFFPLLQAGRSEAAASYSPAAHLGGSAAALVTRPL